MEEAEPPECPVCLQCYDDVSAIPRVLTCGHTTCEACLKQLPRPFPNTIRCTVCTLLLKLPNSSPSSLPKNIDLLHLSSAFQHRRPVKEKKVISQSSPAKIGENLSGLFPSSWQAEFYRAWKKWILPQDCILMEKTGSDYVFNGEVLKSFESDHIIGCAMREKEKVHLVKVGSFVESEEDSRTFKSSYESRILTVVYNMKEADRNGLLTILNASHRVRNVGKAYGFWYNEDDKCVYIVWKKFTSPNLIECILSKQDEEKGKLSTEELSILGMVGVEICEILSYLHFEGLVIGFLDLNCFSFSDFNRVCIDLSEVLNTSKRVNIACKDSECNSSNNSLDLNSVFVSPEMLLRLVVNQKTFSEVGSASDVWSVACLLVRLIAGNSFVQEVKSFLCSITNTANNDRVSEFSSLYMNWMEEIAALLERRLGSVCPSLQKILCRCLMFEPGNRPVISELWKSLRGLVIKPEFDIGLTSKQEPKGESSSCLVLGEICLALEEADKDTSIGDGVESGVERGVKCVEMKGHLDCITGLAIGGGFLFSSSYDKIVRVWSLHDFAHVHSFKGHEHRITCVGFVDGEEPLCISGDNEGVICLWGARFPFSEEPVRKLCEDKDWRYSGIHAMAISGSEYLYTGSGDRLVKAWSLQDYTISCAMSGHNSVVSCLVVCNGVLYSGSWDGTIRLWSLSDHSALAVLGEDEIGNAVPVLSLSADSGLLFVGHENGSVKMWCNDVLVKSTQPHKGAVFSVCSNGKRVFSGGWDKTISVQEITGDMDETEATLLGCIGCNSTVTALKYWNGKLFVGHADRIIKVYHGV